MLSAFTRRFFHKGLGGAVRAYGQHKTPTSSQSSTNRPQQINPNVPGLSEKCVDVPNSHELFSETKLVKNALVESRETTETDFAEENSILEAAERERRKLNIIIRGATFDDSNLKAEVEAFFKRKLGQRVQVKDAIKLGRMTDNQTVLAVFGSFAEKRIVMKCRTELKGSRVYLDDDLTKSQREIQWRIWKQAKAEIAKGSQVKKGYMKLIVDGICWRWNEQTGRLEQS
ncbi:uncharacterized protein [Venturia canescens]|uniref:uncharacterized protein isoform X1 n=1 Tax=Venturia canescens TaxID=32260 RepID=UPI001C9D146B|nr:uncharacterized protein LOC122413880 isoform X1 [Venturia canescens]